MLNVAEIIEEEDVLMIASHLDERNRQSFSRLREPQRQVDSNAGRRTEKYRLPLEMGAQEKTP